MAQIEKTQFKNNTGGYIGVVVIGPRGDDRGAAVEPDGTVWLSEAEQRLTANAPRSPRDNPFIEQTLQRINAETGELESYEVVPLTVISIGASTGPSSDAMVPASASNGMPPARPDRIIASASACAGVAFSSMNTATFPLPS